MTPRRMLLRALVALTVVGCLAVPVAAASASGSSLTSFARAADQACDRFNARVGFAATVIELQLGQGNVSAAHRHQLQARFMVYLGRQSALSFRELATQHLSGTAERRWQRSLRLGQRASAIDVELGKLMLRARGSALVVRQNEMVDRYNRLIEPFVHETSRLALPACEREAAGE